MNNINSFQDLASLKLILFFASALLIIFVGVIGWFLNRRDTAMNTVTESLTSAVIDLRIVVKSLQVQHDLRQPMIDATFEINRKSIDELFDKHSSLDTRLLKLETEHRLFNCSLKSVNINTFQV